jgi:hypothetical protein
LSDLQKKNRELSGVGYWGVMVIIALWRGMKAQKKIADSIERIEVIIKRNWSGLQDS